MMTPKHFERRRRARPERLRCSTARPIVSHSRDVEILVLAVERIESGLADAARGRIDNARERDVVVGFRELQIGDDVFDFRALVKREAADDVIRDTAPPERFFEQARLRFVR